MSVAMTDAVPLTAPDGVTGQNNGRDIRKFLSGLLLPDVKSANPLAVRNGVLPHNWDTNGCTSLRVQQQTTATMFVDALAGHCICERIGQGPYLGWSETTLSPQHATSDPTNARMDIVYAAIYDQASIPTDTSHGPVVDIAKGVADGSLTLPTALLPDGAVPLANVKVRAGATSILSTDITDVRKSTALTGAIRHLLPGDSVADVGKIDGEIRYRMGVAPLPSLIDYWDAAQALWRGTQPLMVQGTLPGTPNVNGVVSAILTSGSTDILSITVPDPGWPYRLMGMAEFQNSNALGGVNYYIKSAGGTLITSIINSAAAEKIVLIPNSNTVFTGSQTVKLHADVISGGPGCGWSSDVRNLVTIQINPA